MIEVPSQMDTATLADWAEASCLFGNMAYISEYELESTLEEHGILDPEEVILNILQEIDIRHFMAGGAHPVRVIQGRLERIKQWDESLAYSFQLLLAMNFLYPSTRIRASKRISISKLFERLSTLALEQYIGGKAINIGAPREGEIPSRFSDCLNYLCTSLKEVKGSERMYTSQTKEDGVDIVAWLPFGDERPSQIVILAQCATGKKWRSKIRGSEIPLNVWQQHINWATKPLKAFAFPFVCIDDFKWRRFSCEAEGLVIDRLRIASMFFANASDPLLQQIREWCKTQMVLLPWIEK